MSTRILTILKTAAAAGCALFSAAGFTSAHAADSPYFVQIDEGGKSATSQHIVLSLNKAAIIQLPRGASDVLVSQPSVVDAVVRSPRRVYLLGLQVGQTNAFFFDAQGKQILNLEIRVERDVSDLQDLLTRLIPDSRIEVEAVNDNIVLKGTVANNAQLANAADIASRFIADPTKVLNMIAVRERDQVSLHVRIVEMQRSMVKQLGIDTSGVVSLSNASIAAAATSIASGATSGLSTQASRAFGSQGNSSLNLSFQALEQLGIVKTLAEPNLTAISGETASFLAGGEFPIPVGQDRGVISIQFKQFGVSLGFTPVVMSKGRINMKVATEVSELSNTNGFVLTTSTATGASQQQSGGGSTFLVDTNNDGIPDTSFNTNDFTPVDANGDGVFDGAVPNNTGSPSTGATSASLAIPGLTVRRAKTTVELPSGGSLVMAGLLQQNLRQAINGVPGLKDVPVLGQLFRSQDYQSNETELVIIVTPYLVQPTQLSKLTDPSEGFVPSSDAQSILLGKLYATYGLKGGDTEERQLQGPTGFILD